MEIVLQATLPVFGLIWLGYFFKHIRLPGDDFWPAAERLTYYVFLPSLFFLTLLRADFAALSNVSELIAATTLTIILTSAITFVLQYSWLRLDGPRFASFYQGTIRFNNYVGIPIIFSLFGEAGLVVYTVLIGVGIPVTNILTVAVMSHWASHEPLHPVRMLKSIVTNPLILGALGGLAFNLLELPLFYAKDMLGFFAGAATALGLLTVGAAIDFTAITSSKRNLSVSCLLKLVINPLVMYVVCAWYDITGMARDVALIYAALPVATSAYILARQFGAYAPLMTSIIITTTLVAMGSLTALLVWIL